MIDLRFHHAGDLPVAFGTAPDLTFRPERVLAQFPNRRVVVAFDLVRKGEGGWIKDADLGSEQSQKARSFLDGEG